MSIANRIAEAAYLELACKEPDGLWELWHGEPKAKPGMTWEHNDFAAELGFELRLQLDPANFRVRYQAPHLRTKSGNYFIPDVAVVPVGLGLPLRGRPGVLETYQDPLPLVVEIWSRSTGDYDVSAKLAAYQARGDAEIWRLHPYERSLRRWVRQPDGTYAEETFDGGIVALAALPDVTVDLDALFDR